MHTLPLLDTRPSPRRGVARRLRRVLTCLAWGAALLAPLAASAQWNASPGQLDFGAVPVGQWSERDWTLTNTSGLNLKHFTVPQGWAPASNAFSIVSDGCSGLQIDAGLSCVIRIRFTPAQPVQYDTNGLMYIGAQSTLPTLLPVTGVGVAADAQFSVYPLTLPFGFFAPSGAPATRQVTIRNISGSPQTPVPSGGAVAAPFSQSHGCAGPLAPGAACQWAFTFTPPAQPGGYEAQSAPLTLGDGHDYRVRLSATVNNPASRFQVSPVTIDFGTVAPGSTAARSATVAYMNGSDPSVTMTTTGLNVPAPFSVQDSCHGQVVALGRHLLFDLPF